MILETKLFKQIKGGKYLMMWKEDIVDDTWDRDSKYKMLSEVYILGDGYIGIWIYWEMDIMGIEYILGDWCIRINQCKNILEIRNIEKWIYNRRLI